MFIGVNYLLLVIEYDSVKRSTLLYIKAKKSSVSSVLTNRIQLAKFSKPQM